MRRAANSKHIGFLMKPIWTNILMLVPIAFARTPCYFLDSFVQNDVRSPINFDIFLFSHCQNVTGAEVSLEATDVSNFQLASFRSSFFLPPNRKTALIRSLSGPTLIVLDCTNKNRTEDLMNELQDIYRSIAGGNRGLWLPAFGILINAHQIQQETLERWASMFAADSQIYIMFMENCQGGFATVKYASEIYEITNSSIVRPVLPYNSSKLCKGVNFSTLAEIMETRTKRRLDFQKALIVGITVENPNYEATIKYKHFNGSDNLAFDGGFVVYEFWYLRDALNFTEGARSWPSYLRQGKHGNLTGLAVPINSGDVDICIGYTEFLEYRMAAPNGITFLHPTFYNRIAAFFVQPAASSFRDVYYNAFTNDIWVALVITWLLLIFSLRLFVYIKLRYGKNVHSRDIQLSDSSSIWVVAAFCQKGKHGFHVSPFSRPIRLIFLVGILVGLLMYTAYSASLTAILSSEVVPVKSFQDLLANNFEIFSDSHIPTTAAILQSLEHEGIVKQLQGEDGRNVDIATTIPKLVKSRTAILSFTDSFDQVAMKRHYQPTFLCQKVRTVLYRRTPAVAAMFVRRGSPLREYFNCKIALMKERGILHRLRKQYMDATTVTCLESHGGFRQRLGVKDLFTAYVILAVGLVTSLVAGILERLKALKFINISTFTGD